MHTKQLVIGLAPTRRDTKDFELEYAHERKRQVEEAVRRIAERFGANVVTADFVNEEGLMIFPPTRKRLRRFFGKKRWMP